MSRREFIIRNRAIVIGVLVTLAMVPLVSAAVGDQVDQFTVPVATGSANCSIGLAYDGTYLYYDRCGDPNIYLVNPSTGALVDTFDTGLTTVPPAALAYDTTRNGLWMGSRYCSGTGMPIHFWDFSDDSVTLVFTIPHTLNNPATNQSFLGYCLCDGLAFNANNTGNAGDDELWFSDDINNNIGVFRPDGTFVKGFDATSVDSSLNLTSGLAIGGNMLYLGNNGGGDVFIADATADPLTLVSQFVIGDERQEDMACDQTTFPVPVMWIRTTPQGGYYPDVITAYEVEPGTCGVGGVVPVFIDGFESGDTLAWSSTVP
jgi:DNA-binding beta-propeller fold protein YncE